MAVNKAPLPPANQTAGPLERVVANRGVHAP